MKLWFFEFLREKVREIGKLVWNCVVREVGNKIYCMIERNELNFVLELLGGLEIWGLRKFDCVVIIISVE